MRIAFLVFLVLAGIIIGFRNLMNSPVEAAMPDIKNPVVVELYTSQSCSSCPPADAVLVELAKDENIIALGCHVTYWDHLSWKDTISLQECTDRQRNYEQHFNNGVYTPQMIINGEESVIGSRKDKVAGAIKGAQPIHKVYVSFRGARVEASFTDSLGKGDYFVTAFGVLKSKTQEITRGENSGSKVVYARPVTEIVSLGPWDGKPTNIKADFSTQSEGAVVLVQDAKTWKILAAGQAFAGQ